MKAYFQNRKLRQIIRLFKQSNFTAHERAAKELRKFSQNKLDSSVVTRLLLEASNEFPQRESDWQSTQRELLQATYKSVGPEHVAQALDCFGRGPDSVKEELLFVLATIDSLEAGEAYLEALRVGLTSKQVKRIGLFPIAENPRYPALFFPKLLEFVEFPDAEMEIYIALIAFLKKGLIPADNVEEIAAYTIESIQKRTARLLQAQDEAKVGWLWEETYVDDRMPVSAMLDALGYLDSDRSPALLSTFAQSDDPRLKFYASISLLRLGHESPQSTWQEIASHAETRLLLFDELKTLNQLVLFPPEQFTKQAFAEADLVRWLTFPTELAGAPDAIEFKKLFKRPQGADGNVALYYLFRFRTFLPHWAAKDGWMVGLSGPYSETSAPGDDHPHATFSTFAKWDSQTPTAHFDEILQIVGE